MRGMRECGKHGPGIRGRRGPNQVLFTVAAGVVDRFSPFNGQMVDLQDAAHRTKAGREALPDAPKRLFSRRLVLKVVVLADPRDFDPAVVQDVQQVVCPESLVGLAGQLDG